MDQGMIIIMEARVCALSSYVVAWRRYLQVDCWAVNARSRRAWENNAGCGGRCYEQRQVSLRWAPAPPSAFPRLSRERRCTRAMKGRQSAAGRWFSDTALCADNDLWPGVRRTGGCSKCRRNACGRWSGRRNVHRRRRTNSNRPCTNIPINYARNRPIRSGNGHTNRR